MPDCETKKRRIGIWRRGGSVYVNLAGEVCKSKSSAIRWCNQDEQFLAQIGGFDRIIDEPHLIVNGCDLKPNSLAISARVGGAPVRAMALWMRSRICCCLGVSLGCSMVRGSCALRCESWLLFFYPVTVFLTSF